MSLGVSDLRSSSNFYELCLELWASAALTAAGKDVAGPDPGLVMVRATWLHRVKDPDGHRLESVFDTPAV
jgi:hypothetical protein